jgi:hypothetical protein
MEKTEEIEKIRRDAFVEGYVAACREFTSGCVSAVTLAFRAYEKLKR